MPRPFKNAGVLALALALVAGLWALALAQEAPRMSLDELKSLLEKGPVNVVDVRQPADWAASDQMIKGAVRQLPGAVEEWAGQYPKDQTLVLYCA
ncbi:MAG: hypothetical protein KQJ78_12055 [Deltaproteobacteria bacterium]|nr:hypothetical protein [Deltaproteobacteria bacterium]